MSLSLFSASVPASTISLHVEIIPALSWRSSSSRKVRKATNPLMLVPEDPRMHAKTLARSSKLHLLRRISSAALKWYAVHGIAPCFMSCMRAKAFADSRCAGNFSMRQTKICSIGTTSYSSSNSYHAPGSCAGHTLPYRSVYSPHPGTSFASFHSLRVLCTSSTAAVTASSCPFAASLRSSLPPWSRSMLSMQALNQKLRSSSTLRSGSTMLTTPFDDVVLLPASILRLTRAELTPGLGARVHGLGGRVFIFFFLPSIICLSIIFRSQRGTGGAGRTAAPATTPSVTAASCAVHITAANAAAMCATSRPPSTATRASAIADTSTAVISVINRIVCSSISSTVRFGLVTIPIGRRTMSNNSRVWLSTRGDSISLSHSMTGPGGP